MIVAMSLHAFLDESRRGSTYLVAVVTMRSRNLDRARSALRAKVKPGQRRLHFKKENTTRQGEIVTLMHGLDMRARLWLCDHSNDVIARRVCLTAIAAHLLESGVTRLALESCQHQDSRDRTTLAAVVGKADEFSYEHFRPQEDPLLWLSDSVAWCYGVGGEWRRRVLGLIDGVHRLEVP
ncbi:hypothetical protein DFJ66_5314 [Saccharothrix variisporea]|uniref:DUF3800 domain-containing protein n=2 Tax=Saccharothrix variisporea TaxID=543527 RepID=A0A495XDB6_9PSEU|nr:hypothetical protein DFJ66_5314 [Saccharothrix variisporea]